MQRINAIKASLPYAVQEFSYGGVLGELPENNPDNIFSP